MAPRRPGVLAVTAALALILAVVSVAPTIILGPVLRVGDHLIHEVNQFTSVAQAINNSMVDQETGQRGYVITGNEAFLEPYYRGRSELEALWPVAAQHAAGVGGEAPALLAAVQRSARAWQTQAGDAEVALVQAGRRDEAVRVIAAGTGKALFDTYRRDHGALLDYARSVYTNQDRARTQLITWVNGTVRGLAILGLLALALLLYLAWATSRAQIQAALATEQRRFGALIEHSSDAITLLAPDGTHLYASPSITRLLGYGSEDLVGVPWSALVHPDDQPAHTHLLAQLRQQPGTGITTELRHRRKDGAWRWLEGVATNLLAEPSVGAIVCNLRDITDRREGEEALRESNRRLEEALAEVSRREELIRQQAERLRLLNDFARSVSSTLDLQSVSALVIQQITALLRCTWCTILQHDPQAGQFRVAAAGEGVPLRPQDTLPEQSAAGVALRTRAPYVVDDLHEAAFPGLQRVEEQRGVRSLVCVPIIINNGVWGTLNVGFAEPHAATPEQVEFINSIAGHLAVAVKNAQLYSDLHAALADLRAAQQQVVQQERLRALGEMASGIAHDFNNALAPVTGFTELLLLHPEQLADTEKTRRYVELINTGAKDAANVVKRLREFYRQRGQEESFTPVHLHQLVEQTVSLTQPRWKDQAQATGRTIRIKTDLQPVPPVAGNEAELREALTNLIFNAVDALPVGGTITLRTRLEDPQAGAGAQRVLLEVSDTGTGMTEEVRQRCLEPFFSTKGNEGTGLGLAMVYGIVQRHGGTLAIESAPRQGTTFRLSLPVQEAQEAAQRAAGDGTPSRQLRVLVVDDEPAVRQVTAAYLGVDGHAVEMAANGRQALELFEANHFDVVLTDRAMPGMSGDQLAVAVKEMAPDTPVILLTGFGDLMVSGGDKLAGVDRIVGKPVTLQKLRQALAEATENREAAAA